MRVLLVTMYFPPAGGGGVARPTKLAGHLADLGFDVHVLAPDDSKWLYRDDVLAIPPNVEVHRAKYVGPKGSPAGRGAARARRSRPRPAPGGPLLAAPARARRVRQLGPDRDSGRPPDRSRREDRRPRDHLAARLGQPDRRRGQAGDRRLLGRRPARLGRGEPGPSGRPARRAHERADAGGRGEARRALGGRRRHRLGRDLERDARSSGRSGWRRSRTAATSRTSRTSSTTGAERFRITHTGTFFGHRDPRPFLTALAEVDGDVVARFVGGLRSTDREFAEELGLGDRIEEIEHVPRQSALELQRDSDALLLLLPDAAGRGKTVPSGKIYEYLAAERPDPRCGAAGRGCGRARAARPRGRRRRPGRRARAESCDQRPPGTLGEGRPREREPAAGAEGRALAAHALQGVRRPPERTSHETSARG